MDFGTYDPVQRAQDGEWLHIVDPETFEPVFIEPGKPSRILLQGLFSSAFMPMMKSFENKSALIRAKMTRADNPSARATLERQLADLSEKHDLDLTRAAIIDWENIKFNGKVLAFSEEAKELLVPQPGPDVMRRKWLIKQIGDFCKDQANFFRKARVD